MDRVRRRKKTRGVNASAPQAARAERADARSPAGARARASVVALTVTPERMLERAAKKFVAHPTNACIKCGSTFIAYEPAFIHCHYCGKMARIANASLGAQELFELRLGLRLAS